VLVDVVEEAALPFEFAAHWCFAGPGFLKLFPEIVVDLFETLAATEVLARAAEIRKPKAAEISIYIGRTSAVVSIMQLSPMGSVRG
jgi:hypothetical protein